MASGHLLDTLAVRFEPPGIDLDLDRACSVRVAHLKSMGTHAEIADLFEPLLTLAELAIYLDVPVQTLYDLRAKGRGPRGFRIGRCLHFRKSEIDAWLLDLEGGDQRQDRARSPR